MGRDHCRLVWAALTYLREVKGRACVVRVVHISGTIKKAEITAVRRAKRDIALVAAQDREAVLAELAVLQDGVGEDEEE